MGNGRIFELNNLDIASAQAMLKTLAPGLSVERLTPITTGMSTSNFIANASDGRKYVLRIYPETNDNCRLEAAMYAHVRFFMDVPEVLCCDDSGAVIPNSYLILEYVEGQTLGDYITESKRLPGKLVRAISSALALLHRREYPRMARLDAELNESIILDDFGHQFETLIAGHAGSHISSSVRERLEKFFVDNAKLISEISSQNTLTHGDVNFSNIIVSPSEKPCFIDFEYAFAAPRYCDIGKFFRTRKPEIERQISPSVIAAFYEGYNAGAPATLARHWYAYSKIADMQALLYLINKPEPHEGWIADIEKELLKTLKLFAA